MSKALIILCISLGALVAVGYAQEDTDELNVLEDLENESTEESLTAAVAAKKPISLAFLPTLDDIAEGMRNAAKKHELDLANNLAKTMTTAKDVINVINATMNFWQYEHQLWVMNNGTAKADKYQADKARYPGKDFTKCDKIFSKIVDFLNRIGNGFYECHHHYDKHLLYLATKIHASAQPELKVLRAVKETDCKVSSANDDSSKTEALKCLISNLIKLYTRPQSQNAFFFYLESIKEMGENQVRGFTHLCPAIYQWEVYNHLQSSWFSSLERCVIRQGKS